MLTKIVHDARIGKFDKHLALDENVDPWSGDSRGHSDNDTLVVVTQTPLLTAPLTPKTDSKPAYNPLLYYNSIHFNI